MVLTRNQMLSYYMDNPTTDLIDREINKARMEYFCFDNDLKLETKENEVLNACFLSGEGIIHHQEDQIHINQFDFFFLPPEDKLLLKIDPKPSKIYKICLMYSPISESVNVPFEVQHYDPEKFIPRGEKGSSDVMATYRTVWTAIKNGYFMSGFTNIPNESLQQGVITSVNLEKGAEGKTEIYPHIHPEFPEVYIMCIEDKNYAISQFIINEEGKTVCRDLCDGNGLFFPGEYGHSNFARPFYKELKYCMYMWMMPTFGRTETITPTTLRY